MRRVDRQNWRIVRRLGRVHAPCSPDADVNYDGIDAINGMHV